MLCVKPVFWDPLDKWVSRGDPNSTRRVTDWLPLGKIIAVCELAECVQIQKERDEFAVSHLRAPEYNGWVKLPPDEPELSFGDYTPGRYAWILANVRELKSPPTARGALGLWEYPEGLVLA
jgi:hypothetical protein